MGRIRDDLRGHPGGLHDSLRQLPGLASTISGDFSEDPARAGGQLRPTWHQSGDPVVEPFTRDEWMREQSWYGVCCSRHRWIAEHGQGAIGSICHQSHCGFEHHTEGAFGADQEAIEAAFVFRQQVLKRIARHLAAKTAKLRADQPKVVVNQFVESSGLLDDTPVSEEGPHRLDIVDRAAIAERS